MSLSFMLLLSERHDVAEKMFRVTSKYVGVAAAVTGMPMPRTPTRMYVLAYVCNAMD